MKGFLDKTSSTKSSAADPAAKRGLLLVLSLLLLAFASLLALVTEYDAAETALRLSLSLSPSSFWRHRRRGSVPCRCLFCLSLSAHSRLVSHILHSLFRLGLQEIALHKRTRTITKTCNLSISPTPKTANLFFHRRRRRRGRRSRST